MTRLKDLTQRPATHLLSTRVDGRYLAALATYWNSRGEAPRSLSELARLSLEGFSALLVANRLVELPTHAEALQVLEALGLSARRVNRQSLLQVLHQEDLDLSALESPETSTYPFNLGATTQNEALTELNRRLSYPLNSQDTARNEEFKTAFQAPQSPMDPLGPKEVE